MDRLSRRNLLRLAGTIGAIGFVAGCGKPGTSARAAASPSPDPAPSAPPIPASPTIGPSAPPAPPIWSTLAKSMRGTVLLPADPNYPSAAKLYSPRFDRTAQPAAVARCVTDADVAAAVNFAAQSQVPFALRSGGHSYAGWSTTAGLVIDVSAMNQVVVDTASKTARIAAGANLATVYAALGAQNMALAAGSCPTVGIAGLAQGGGVGVLTRAYGLTCDAVRVIDVVTADGRLRQVSSSADSELLWALRGGGGGSFGAVTAFTVALAPAPTVRTFYYAWPFERADQVLDEWQVWIADADRRITSTCKLLSDPGKATQTALIAGTWIGPATDLAAQLKPLLSKLPKPTTSSVHTHTYAEAMFLEAGCSGTDPASCVAGALSPASRQAFSATSSVLYGKLSSLGVKTVVDNAGAAINVSGMIEGGVSFDALGGAVLDLDDGATAFAHRGAAAIVQYTATYPLGAPTTPYDAYVHAFRNTMSLWMGAGAYVNYADPTITDYPAAYWPTSYPRLQQVKRQYDPDQLFSFPQAVRAS